jgi:hypothetical protein
MITLENIAATTVPFTLDTGVFDLVITGEFNGATATLEHRVPDTHEPLWDRVTQLAPFTKIGTANFLVVPNAIGDYRLRVDLGATPPSLTLVIGLPDEPVVKA